MERDPGPFPCPNCGADVPSRARSCPECGSDDDTGWSEDTLYDGLDLPEPGYGRDDEAGDPGAPVRRATATVAAVVLLVLMLAFLIWRAL